MNDRLRTLTAIIVMAFACAGCADVVVAPLSTPSAAPFATTAPTAPATTAPTAPATTAPTAPATTAPTAPATAGASSELTAVLDVTCGPGAPVLGSDRVRASDDGIRIRVTGQPGWSLGVGYPLGHESAVLEAGSQNLVLRIAPGDVTVDCEDPTLPNTPPTSNLTIEDPDGWYRPVAIGDNAGSCVSGSSDFAEGARGKTIEPVLQARSALRGLRPGDIVERAGYPVDRGSVRVVRAGKVIGVLTYQDDGAGGWLLTGTTLCGGLGAG